MYDRLPPCVPEKRHEKMYDLRSWLSTIRCPYGLHVDGNVWQIAGSHVIYKIRRLNISFIFPPFIKDFRLLNRMMSGLCKKQIFPRKLRPAYVASTLMIVFNGVSKHKQVPCFSSSRQTTTCLVQCSWSWSRNHARKFPGVNQAFFYQLELFSGFTKDIIFPWFLYYRPC